VLTVDMNRANARRKGSAMFKNLLVPVDGHELSDTAMLNSIRLAHQLGASITAFVAEPTPPLPAVGRPASLVTLEHELHDARTARHASSVLQLFEARARSAGVPFSGHHKQAMHIPDAIAEAASEHGCDMIVMATHGRGPFGELMFGSNTKGVMSRTRLPLLVLH
jgi:nucleotide-binding universal stress UspA family protein